MFKPIYKESRLVVGNPKSNVGIVSLWTKNKKIAEKLDPNKYAVIGQLFSAERGLDIFVRNMLANPDINVIVVTGTDFSNSGKVLLDFFENGFEMGRKELTDKEVWRVKSEYPGYIETDIPKEALNEIRETTKAVMVEDIEHFDFSSIKPPERKREKLIFKRREEKTREFYGENAVYVVRHKNVIGAWLQMLDTIMKFGTRCGTHYDDEQKEILNLVSVITHEDPDNLLVPEFLPCDKKHIEEYIPKITTDFKEEGTSYTYGSRMRSWFGKDQVKEAVAKLIRELNSRAVVINLWDSTQDLTIGGSPCINHIWLRVRNNRLHLITTIRSNDIFEAYPENAFGLRVLQGVILKELNRRLNIKKTMKGDIGLGDLVINSQSAHVYDDCFESVEEIINKNYKFYVPKAEMMFDFRGNFSINVQDGEIVVEHLSPKNEVIGLYRGKSALELREKIIRDNVIGNTAHGFYIGMELQKAQTALETGSGYEQDENLKFVVPQHNQIISHDHEPPIDIDGKRMHVLPRHGRLIRIQRLHETNEAILTYIVNDREIPTPNTTPAEEEKFKEFLRGLGMSRVF